jgi:hypothetical protein|tara:strand:+ start:415 stop:585 length:171 start_codon:yes stop_codon:yes gene_type:complete
MKAVDPTCGAGLGENTNRLGFNPRPDQVGDNQSAEVQAVVAWARRFARRFEGRTEA